MNKTTQTGFTLVELVIVILILGILSAVALPRFMNLGRDARVAKLEAVYGSVRAAAQITRAAALIRNQVDAGPGGASEIEMEGATVQTNYGYPEASATAGILEAAGLNATADKLTVTGGGSTPGSTLTIQVSGASNLAQCQFTYTSPAAANAAPTLSALSTDGC